MRLPYGHLLREGRIRKHRTNAQEITSLFEVVERDLADASVPELSPDRRFATTFEFLGIALGLGFEALAGYFDRCRVKRNIADHVGAGSISETEAGELLGEAGAFTQMARAWIETNYPDLAGWKRKQ